MPKLVTAVIRKCRERDHDPKRPDRKQKWCLYTHTGKKLLGRHPSKSKALRQERAIQWRKHGTSSEELQTTRASATEEALTMANKETPQAVRYMGQLYVFAGDEAPMDDLGEMADMPDEEAPDSEMDEEMEEVDLVDALKGFWQTILDRLPDDLDVDEEFEDALNGMEEVIKVMDEMNAESAAEEEPPVDEELPEEELPEEE